MLVMICDCAFLLIDLFIYYLFKVDVLFWVFLSNNMDKRVVHKIQAIYCTKFDQSKHILLSA